MADREKLSLEQIEGSSWGDAPADASTLISTVHRLRRQPVGSLDAEDLRVPAEHWAARPQELARLRAILPTVDLDDINDDLRADVVAFRAQA